MGSVRPAPLAASRWPSSMISRAESVSGMSWASCLSVHPSVAPLPDGWGVAFRSF